MVYSLGFDSFVLAAATDSVGVEPAAREHADAVEFRLDLADDPWASLTAYDGELPLILTNRPTWEGGEATDEDRRLSLLADALDQPAVAAVDLELHALTGDSDAADTDAAREVRAAARDCGVPVIASVHDFESTPPVASLSALLERTAAEGDVGKLAVTATDRADALSVLQATHEATTAGQRVATMAMGEAGRHTRAVAPLYGSRIGYAPVESSEATAPGQYSLAALSSLVSQL